MSESQPVEADVDTLQTLFEAANQGRTTRVKFVARAAAIAGISASTIDSAAKEAGVDVHPGGGDGRLSMAEDEDGAGSGCSEAGCDGPARFAESVDGQYTLVCGDHAADDSLDLEAVDFSALEGDDLPASVQRLSAVGNLRHFWFNEWDTSDDEEWEDRKTTSLIVREQDGGLVGESERYDFSAAWCLVATDLPDDPDEYRSPSPTIPEWVEWEWCDPPMDHHVEGVRCSVCEQAYDAIHFNRMPQAAASLEPWESVRHRRGCPHATEEDEERWDDRQLAFEIRNRPSPRVMALPALWDEIEWWHELREEDHHAVVYEAITDRERSFSHVLKDRLDPNYPECHECGKVPRRADEYLLECNCRRVLDLVSDKWWQQHARIWGRRGHGGRKPVEVES